MFLMPVCVGKDSGRTVGPPDDNCATRPVPPGQATPGRGSGVEHRGGRGGLLRQVCSVKGDSRPSQRREPQHLRILLIGASGFIGSSVAGRLKGDGHEVVGVVRRRGPAVDGLGADRIVELNVARTRTADWLAHLDGIDAVVNTAGVLQDSPWESTHGVHAAGAAALFEACEQAGVRRVVHLSAIGVDRGGVSDFSRSKLAGDEALMARDLDWVILRPSVVLGRPAYGAGALFRGLAALPVLPVPGDTGPLQVVHLDDLVQTIVFFVAPDAPARQAIEIAGPERLAFAEVVQAFRRWLGWGPAKVVAMPGWAAAAMYRVGDMAGLLGWRAPMRTTAKREIVRGAVGDPSAWTRLTGIAPRTLHQGLAAEPASVQERWFAQLYFLKPAVFGSLVLFWTLTGVVSLGPGWETGLGHMAKAGAPALAAPGVIAGALADIVVGLGIAFRRTARTALYGAVAVTLLYLVAGTVLLPSLWAEPLGPLLKTLPLLALNLVALAILEDR